MKFDICHLKFPFAAQKGGYSLIELLVVMSIFGITISLVTASYLTFENNQRFRNAALQVKNDIRFAQHKAVSGDKSTSNCQNIDPQKTSLIGWYIRFRQSAIDYTISSDCINALGAETTELYSTVKLPKGISICSVSGSDINILFQATSVSSNFYSSSSTPPFLESGILKTPSIGAPLTVSLVKQGATCNTAGTYQVIVDSNGGVNEIKL